MQVHFPMLEVVLNKDARALTCADAVQAPSLVTSHRVSFLCLSMLIRDGLSSRVTHEVRGSSPFRDRQKYPSMSAVNIRSTLCTSYRYKTYIWGMQVQSIVKVLNQPNSLLFESFLLFLSFRIEDHNKMLFAALIFEMICTSEQVRHLSFSFCPTEFGHRKLVTHAIQGDFFVFSNKRMLFQGP